jgi:hypothetical protein
MARIPVVPSTIASACAIPERACVVTQQRADVGGGVSNRRGGRKGANLGHQNPNACAHLC